MNAGRDVAKMDELAVQAWVASREFEAQPSYPDWLPDDYRSPRVNPGRDPLRVIGEARVARHLLACAVGERSKP